jgi:hypothetical protein
VFEHVDRCMDGLFFTRGCTEGLGDTGSIKNDAARRLVVHVAITATTGLAMDCSVVDGDSAGVKTARRRLGREAMR